MKHLNMCAVNLFKALFSLQLFSLSISSLENTFEERFLILDVGRRQIWRIICVIEERQIRVDVVIVENDIGYCSFTVRQGGTF